jgi:hypothetical protein
VRAYVQEPPDGDWFCPNCERERCGSCGKGQLYLNKHVICGAEVKSKKDPSRNGCDRLFHLVRDVVVRLLGVRVSDRGADCVRGRCFPQFLHAFCSSSLVPCFPRCSLTRVSVCVCSRVLD